MFPKVNVFKVHTLPRFHVVVQTFIVPKEACSLREVGGLGTSTGEAEALCEAQSGDGMLQKALQLLRNVFDPEARIIELGARCMRVDPFMVHLRSRVRVSVSIARHLSGTPYVMVADSLPPDAGCGLLQPLYPVIHLTDFHFSKVSCFGIAVPTLHQVDNVQHGQKGYRYIDVAIGTWAVMIESGSVSVEVGRALVIRSHYGDAVQGAPA